LISPQYKNNNNEDDADDVSTNQLIKCPVCKALSITVEELHEYVNADPEAKMGAIEKEIAMWGLTHHDMAYFVENIVFYHNCARISHLGDWNI
jgi:hypothetical protein